MCKVTLINVQNGVSPAGFWFYHHSKRLYIPSGTSLAFNILPASAQVSEMFGHVEKKARVHLEFT